MNQIFDGAGPSAEWGFGLGGAVFFASIVAVWASIHLRSRTDERLHQRVDVAHAGLAERTTEVLRDLRDDINLILPDSNVFDPQTAFVDPANVAQSAKEGVAVLRMRRLIRSRFALMLRVCTWLRNGCITFTSFVLITTILYFLYFDFYKLWFTLGVLTILIMIFCLAGVAVYSFLESSIQKSVEASNPVTSGETP